MFSSELTEAMTEAAKGEKWPTEQFGTIEKYTNKLSGKEYQITWRLVNEMQSWAKGKPFTVYKTSGGVDMENYSFKSRKEALEFIQKKGGEVPASAFKARRKKAEPEDDVPMSSKSTYRDTTDWSKFQ